MIAGNPAVPRFSGIGLDTDGRPDRPRLDQALHHESAVVRWQLDDQRRP